MMERFGAALSIAGVVMLIVLIAVAFVAILFVPIAYFDSQGCERKGDVQGVETSYHWTTGCVYVDPDYVVTR